MEKEPNHNLSESENPPVEPEVVKEEDEGIIRVDFSQSGKKNTSKSEIKPEDSGEVLHIDFSKGAADAKKNKIPMSKESVRQIYESSPHQAGHGGFGLPEVIFHLTAPEGVDRKEWATAATKAREMSSFLMSLSGRFSRRVYHESFVQIQKLPNEEIIAAILGSDEVDWKSKPAYYKALAEEMDLRAYHPKDFKK